MREDSKDFNDGSPMKPRAINRHLNAVYPALVLLAGMELDLFSYLSEGPKGVDQLAEEMSLKTSKLRPLLYALVSAGLLEVKDEIFMNTEEAQEFLVKGKPRYFGDSYSTYQDLWKSTLFTAQSIRQAIPLAKHDFSNMTTEELHGFIIGLDSGAAATARRLHKNYDFSRYKNVLDAGGGSGGLVVELSKLCPDTRFSLLELPAVAAIAQKRIAKGQLDDQISIIKADLTKDLLGEKSFDAIVLRSVIQVLGLEQSGVALEKLARCLLKGGDFFVIGRVLEDNRLEPAEAVSANVMFLNVYESGGSFTVSEYQRIFSCCGFVMNERLSLTGGYMLMRFSRTGDYEEITHL